MEIKIDFFVVVWETKARKNVEKFWESLESEALIITQ
jgi:hypothetical protein